MRYYVDGYNLMFRLLRAGEDLQKQREQVIRDLNLKAGFLELEVTLVFDSKYQAGAAERVRVEHLDVLYTNEGETADECILEELTGHQETVVTCDRKLAYLSRLKLAKTESVTEFMLWLNKRYKNKIRHLKNPVEEKPQLVQPKKFEPPKPGKNLEESLDYYLHAFGGTNEVAQEKKEYKLKHKLPEETDMDRWLKAFSRIEGDGV